MFLDYPNLLRFFKNMMLKNSFINFSLCVKVRENCSPRKYGFKPEDPSSQSLIVSIKIFPDIDYSAPREIIRFRTMRRNQSLQNQLTHKALKQSLPGSQTGRSPAPTLPWGQWASLRYTSFAGGPGSCGFQEHSVSCE